MRLIFPIKAQRQKTVVFSKVPAKANYRSSPQLRVISQFYAALWTGKANLFNKQSFYQNNTNVLRYQKLQRVRMLSVGIAMIQPHYLLPLVQCPADDTWFKVGPEIRCSDVSSRCCYYGNHAAGSNLILKLSVVFNAESSSLCQK